MPELRIDWEHELSLLPTSWALTPVKEKRPLRPSWQSEQPIDRDILLRLLSTGEELSKSDGGTWHCTWTGIGLRLGSISNNLMAVDVDGPLAGIKLDELSNGDIPETISWTSGKKGRSQMLFLIPDEWVERISTVKLDCGDGDYLEFRWDGTQSVLPPSSHPDTGRYKWLLAPDQAIVAPAPKWLLEYVSSQTHRPVKPAEQIKKTYVSSSHTFPEGDTWDDRDWALSYLDALAPWRADNYDTWVKVGMALHSVGDDSLLDIWDRWSTMSSRYKPGKCEKKWNSFKRDGAGLGTLGYWAKEDGWKHPFKDGNSSSSPQKKDSLPSSSPVVNSNSSSHPSTELAPVATMPQTEQTPEAKTEQWINKNLPPCIPDAEAEVLRLLLMGLCKELDVLGIITNPDVFYIPKHRIVFEAMLHLHKLGMPSNIVSVTDVLRCNGKLNTVGGEQYLISLTDPDFNRMRGDSIESYSRLLVDKWVRRELIKTALDISNLGSDQLSPLDEVLDQSEKLVYRLRNLTPNKDTRSAGEVANSTYEKLSNPSAILPTGFPSLDNLLVGLEAETLTVIAARSSMGKTAFSLQLLLQMVELHGKHSAYFSLEMPEWQLMHRLWCMMSTHPYYKDYGFRPIAPNQIKEHRSGIKPFTQEELDNLTAIASLSTELNFSINDSRNITPTGIGSECRKLKSHYDNELGVIIIDYLQLFAGEGGDAAETSNRLLGVTRYFYNLAQELKCPVIILAQINRGTEGRQDKRPSMSDLAQSGGVEWIADNILMLYREGYYSTENPDDPALEVICRKARQGATGTAKMCFDKERLLVYEAQPGYF